ncbi:MAG: lysophospholipid acyltransferase family protein [Acidobacteriota bacterium]
MTVNGAAEAPQQHSLAKRVLMRHVVPFVALNLLRLLDLTWRYRLLHRERLQACLDADEPVVAAFLHGRTFALLRHMTRPKNGRWQSMCSKSLDGDAMTKVEEGLGLKVVRGSSGTDGLEAIVEMIRNARDDRGLGSCLAIDGSRGPRGRVQGGIVSLAVRCGGAILPVTASAKPAFVFRRAWDRTLLPLPFARVVIAFGEPIEVPRRPKSAQTEEIRRKLEEELVVLQAEADVESGWSDPAGVFDV